MPEASPLSRFAPLQTILCCPHSRSKLSLLTASELHRRLAEEERRRVPNDCMGAFVSEASQTAYPIVAGIVDFLEQDSLRLSRDRPPERTGLEAANASIQQSVKQWYDEFGWRKNASGIYNDSALFSQQSLTAHGVYELASHLSLLDRLPGGDFILDAASGPIPHPEYLAYSWFYKHRVCVDISLTALREAQAKLEGKGFGVMANICQLPFRESVFDGVVSGYTVQHVAESQQSQAVSELYRVLKPGSHLCVITGLTQSRAHRALARAMRAVRKARRLLTIRRTQASRQPVAPSSAFPTPPHDLYCYLRDFAWWRNLARSLTDSYALQGCRIFAKDEFEYLFGESVPAAKTTRALEVLFPGLSARMCTYLLVDFLKPLD